MRGSTAALAIALVVAGCGGGDEIVPTDPAAGAGTAPVATTPGAVTPGTTVADGTGTGAPAEAEEGTNELGSADASNGSQVKISSRTPKAFVKAHCAKPIVIVLHQPGAIIDSALLEQARIAAKATKDEKLLEYTPNDVRDYGDLLAKVGLLRAPGVAIVSRDGSVQNFWTTYIDNKLIEASLRNAAAAKGCKVDVEAVEAEQKAAAATPLSNAAALASGTATPSSIAAADAASAAAAGTSTIAPALAGDPALASAATGTAAPTAAAAPITTPAG